MSLVHMKKYNPCRCPEPIHGPATVVLHLPAFFVDQQIDVVHAVLPLHNFIYHIQWVKMPNVVSKQRRVAHVQLRHQLRATQYLFCSFLLKPAMFIFIHVVIA